MRMRRMKIHQIFLSILLMNDVCGLPSSHKRMVMFTDSASWNTANLVCHVTGGALLTIADEEERLAVKGFLSQSLWKDETGYSSRFWIGLHVESYSSPSTYYWSTCDGPFDPTEPGWLTSAETSCVEISKSAAVDDSDCSKFKKYICEYIGGQCPFAVFQDTVGDDSNPSYLTAIDADECLDICSSYLQDGLECWAATWHATSRRCGLHYPASKSYYDDPANRDSVVGYTLYVKSCYSAEVDNTKYPGYNVNSTFAIETCDESYPYGQAKVYSLFTLPKTWDEARYTCQQLGYELLILDSPTDYMDLGHIFGDSLSRYWIGLSGANQNFSWVTEQQFVWSSWAATEPFKSPEVTCVLSASDSKEWTTADCSEELPYICEMTTASCTYETLKKTKGPKNNNQGSLTFDQCRGACESHVDCRGFTHWHMFFYYKCYIHVHPDPRYLFDPENIEHDSFLMLYRFTCAFGVSSDKEPLVYSPEPTVKGFNITEYSSESSSSLVENVMTSSSFELISSSSIIFHATTTGSSSNSHVTNTMTTASVDDSIYLSEPPAIQDKSCSVTLESSLSIFESDPFLLPPTEFPGSPSSTTESFVASLSTTEYFSVSPTSSLSGFNVLPSSSTESVSTLQSTVTLVPTTSVSYTAPPPTASTIKVCSCRCIKNRTTADTEKMIQEIQETLFVEPKSTSKSIMTKKSAEDERPSAQTVGYAAITFLTLTFGGFFLLDVSTLVEHVIRAVYRMHHKPR